MVAYVTAGFHASKWTDQEVGWALGRQALIVPVNAGQNPYGFFGAIQAAPLRSAESLPEDVTRALSTAVFRRQQPHASDFEASMADVLVNMFCVSNSFNTTRRRFPMLQLIPAHAWRVDHDERLRVAATENSQIREANLVEGATVPDALSELIRKRGQ